jgi:hypothetical protein
VNDQGISELLGYAIMIGMVVTAVICVTSGAAGVIYSAAESISHSEAAASLETLAAIAVDVTRTNNTCYVAYELQMPAGYVLLAMDQGDDISRLSVKLGNKEVPAIRTGSIRLQSPFRSVSFEGGAVIGNDSGIVDIIREPSIFVASHDGQKGLYIYLVCIKADTGAISSDSHAILDIRAVSQRLESINVPAPSDTIISVSSRDPEGWAMFLQNEGFTVTCNGNTVTAVSGGVTDVHVTCVMLQVRPDRQ